MSDDGFHVHGPHDHEVEHATVHSKDGFTSKVAVMTAVLSTVGAIFGYMGGHTQNEALLYKNEAAIYKTSASDQWNYYQAKSNRQSLAELSMNLAVGELHEKYKQAATRYNLEKEVIKAEAEKLDEQSKAENEKSLEAMHIHERWALATTLIQIAIAMAAIALLTKREWMLWGVYGASALGLGAAVTGFLQI